MDMETHRAPRVTGPIVPAERAPDEGGGHDYRLAASLREIDLPRAFDQTTRLIQRYPVHALIAGAALGFAIAAWQTRQS